MCVHVSVYSVMVLYIQGMRIVEREEDFYNMLNACRSEAMKSFSDDKVLIEKFVERPR